jgi:hypothetical protein
VSPLAALDALLFVFFGSLQEESRRANRKYIKFGRFMDCVLMRLGLISHLINVIL